MEKEKGFVRKDVTLYIQTTLGDRWKSDDCKFRELKDGGYVVEEKESIPATVLPGTNPPNDK